MISGDVIWCCVCGAYADRKVSGLTTKCDGKHTGPWKGGGKKGQLNDLRKNRHPKTKLRLPDPIPESTMTLDAAASASHPELAEAANRMARYSAKDKAVARANASNPLAALTDERKQWIENKRRQAVRRAASKDEQLRRTSPSTADPPSAGWTTRILACYAKRPRLELSNASSATTTTSTDVATGTDTDMGQTKGDSISKVRPGPIGTGSDKAAKVPRLHQRCLRLTCFDTDCDGLHDDEPIDITRCSDCDAHQQWNYCRACDTVQCTRCVAHQQCTHCTSLICAKCSEQHRDQCEDAPPTGSGGQRARRRSSPHYSARAPPADCIAGAEPQSHQNAKSGRKLGRRRNLAAYPQVSAACYIRQARSRSRDRQRHSERSRRYCWHGAPARRNGHEPWAGAP